METEWNSGAIAADPRVLWEKDVGMGYSNVALRGDRLYAHGIVGPKNTVSCLDAETGKTMWEYSDESFEIPQSTPAVDGKSVFVVNKDGIILSINAQSGKIQWKKDIVAEYGAVKPHYGFGGSPVVDGNLLILNVNTAGMALDKKTGQLVWGSEAPPVEEILDRISSDNGATYMTPVVYERAGKRLSLIYSWKGLFSVDVKTGRQVWSYPWVNYDTARTPDPVILNDQILLADDCSQGDSNKRFSTLLSIAADRPSVVWKSSFLYSDIASPIVIGEYIYGVFGGMYPSSSMTSVRCIDVKGGQLSWEHKPAGSSRKRWISLSAADGKLFVLYESGRLEIIEATPTGYQVISGCDLPKAGDEVVRYATAPVLSRGRLYCRNFSGMLRCIDLRN